MLSKIINYYKWKALISFLVEKEKKTRREKRKEKKFVRLQPRDLTLALHASQLSNTVYQRIELT